MGCTCSVYVVGRKKRKNIPEIAVFFPLFQVPLQSDLQRTLTGLISKDLVDRISSLRNRIVLVVEGTGGSAFGELQKALEEYLSLLTALTKKEQGLQEVVEFKWKDLENGKQEICVANSWFEILAILNMMATLTLMEANSMLIPSHDSSSDMTEPADCMRNAIDLLLKAAGYMIFCIRDVLRKLPLKIRNRLSLDMQENVLEAISYQALGQGNEVQLGLAVQSQNATLSVKRRLACEQLSYFSKAHCCLTEGSKNSSEPRKKHLLFIKWKYLESKAAAYYHHGLILDKGNEPSSHVNALACFLAADKLLADSKKACLTFCLTQPVTKAPLPWGVMKHLIKKIPETAYKKSEMNAYLFELKKCLHVLPDQPEFQLSLKPDGYELPESDSSWDFGISVTHEQALKDDLKDSEDGKKLDT